MHWLIIIAFAIVFGWTLSLVMRRYGMGVIVCVPVALLGAGLGGALDRLVTQVDTPAYSFYGLSLLLSLLALGGATWAYMLTKTERRI